MNTVQSYKIGYFSPELLEEMESETPYISHVINYIRYSLPIYGETLYTDLYSIVDLMDNIHDFPNSEYFTEEYLMDNGVTYEDIISFIDYCNYLDIKVVEINK